MTLEKLKKSVYLKKCLGAFVRLAFAVASEHELLAII